ncbi:MAG: septum formation protein Maf [Spirochaetes bacterium]|nr:septum formation protein Maf [Spirochaetota bacterium]
MNIILGSSSPRRKSILGGLVRSFSIAHPSIVEIPRTGETPEAFSTRIAEDKCRAIETNLYGREFPLLVITADTIVTIDGRVIGKPSDFEDAVAMLMMLKGRTHRVITAVTLLAAENPEAPRTMMTGFEATEVTFRDLDRDGVIRYLNTIDYRDKAGSYAFQEQGSMIVEGFRGSATNIIGFPLRLFFSMLADQGIAGRVFS